MMKRRLALALLFVLMAGLASAQESNHLLIPAAGDVPGANGTHFRSDISITNLRDVDQFVTLIWRPRPEDGAVLQYGVVIPAHGTLQSDNFVADVLHGRGLGTLEIQATGSSVPPAVDAAGRLYATSRIWTPRPGAGGGTVSQSLPAIPYRDLVHERILFTGHRTGAQFRTNLGIVNLIDDVTMSYSVTVTGSVQTFEPLVFFVDVPPLSMKQVAIDWPEDPKLKVEVQALRQPNGAFGTLWTAYLSTIDNLTGDSWSSLGVELEP